MPNVHFILDKRLIGTAFWPDENRETYYEPTRTSVAYFCAHCGDIWARRFIANTEWRTWGRYCRKHFTRTSYYCYDGTFFDSNLPDDFIYPEEVLRSDFLFLMSMMDSGRLIYAQLPSVTAPIYISDEETFYVRDD